jgi:hypothetical protein
MELIGNLRGRAEFVRRKGIAQAEMDDATLGDDSVHSDFTERERADHLDELVLLRSGKNIRFEEKPFWQLRSALK